MLKIFTYYQNVRFINLQFNHNLTGHKIYENGFTDFPLRSTRKSDERLNVMRC